MKKRLLPACLLTACIALIGSSALAQGQCKGSCTNSKSLCMKNSKGNAALCNAQFSKCMASGTWTTQASGSIHNQAATTVTNICKR